MYNIYNCVQLVKNLQWYIQWVVPNTSIHDNMRIFCNLRNLLKHFAHFMYKNIEETIWIFIPAGYTNKLISYF